ncbi:hypothetical protein VMCG_07522 [Cytospora schulzeri]|uniref:FAD dependent oxidoreductase domain-containing protein n=1 Tax=Cytospora schulzeri TaxID=448051 RepID=A0A423W1G3_9PEZI|nr:hypothetical protein VMCG_07522 [Valsa malicola]
MDLLRPFLTLFKTIKTAISILYTLYNDWSKVLSQANSLPGLPVPNPTSSYWQDDPPYPELVDTRSPGGGLPAAADIVIIGSGITGVAVARTVLREWKRKGEQLDGKRLVVLEARQLCSGATGRNGGHIKASLHEVFHTMVGKKGMAPERAAAVCAFQFRHLGALLDVAREEGIEEVSECRRVETVDFAVDGATDEGMKMMMEEFLPYAPEGFQMTGYSGEQARERYKVNERVVGAVSYPAGAIFPYRFVTALWKKLLDEYPEVLCIETSTDVERVEVVDHQDATSKLEDDASFPYSVVTNRGRILTRHVVHATNAFASQLVPGLRGKATSGLCHMTAQRAGGYFPEKDGGRSWSVIYGQGFDYITQRPTGELMVGGGFFQGPKQGMDMIGIYDDSKVDALTLMHIQGVMPAIFDPGYNVSGEGMRLMKAWSGVIGFSPDLMPLVGRLDPRITSRKVKSKKEEGDMGTVEPGEWISAYFCGEGMVWAWLCGTALGIMLAGSEGEDLPAEPGRPGGKLTEWFPRELYASWERVKDMDIADLADAL